MEEESVEKLLWEPIESAETLPNDYSISNPSLYELSDSDDDSIQSLIFRLKQFSLFSPVNKFQLHPEGQPDDNIDNNGSNSYRYQASKYFEAGEREACNSARSVSTLISFPSPLSASTASTPLSSPSLQQLAFQSESSSVAERISQSDLSDLLLDENLLGKTSSTDYDSLQSYRNLHTLAATWSQQQQQPQLVDPLYNSASLYELSNSDSDESIDAVIVRAKALARQLRSSGRAIIVGDEVIVSSLSNSSVSSESISERVESCSSDSSDDSDD